MRNWKRQKAGLALALGIGLMAGATMAQEATVLDPAGGATAGAMAKMEGPSDLEKAVAAQGWVNQSGSVMNFTTYSGGAISGTYVNNAPGTGCQGTVIR